VYEVRHIEMLKEQKKAYDAMKRDFSYNGIRTKYTITQVNYLAQIAGGIDIADKTKWLSNAKVKELISLLKGELKRQQVLIWCRFRHELEMICKSLRAAGLLFDCVHGDISPSERETIRRNFNAGIIPYVVATISSMKAGTNWADKCDTAIYYSNEYSNDARSQSEDRVIHPLKKSPILIIDLVTIGSIDEHVLKLLGEKKFNSEMFMSSLLKNLAESFAK
jgi:SNF2 family DNA or RNA helicase